MTENLHEETNRKIKRGLGVTAVAALGLAVTFAAGRAVPSQETAKGDQYSPNPTTLDMPTSTTGSASAGPSGNPEASSAPSASPEASAQTFEAFSLQPGDKMAVQVGDVVAGDVTMADSDGGPLFPLYDTDGHKAADVTDNTKTALYVIVQQPGELYAPYGAYITRGLTADKLQTWIDLQKSEKERSGFEKVDVVTWTGYNTTTDEAGFMASGNAGSSSSVDMSNGTPSVDQINNMDTSTKLSVILKLFIDNKIDPNSQDAKDLLAILANCLCGCSTPTESPMPSPTPTPETQCVPMNDHFMKAGETYTVTGKEFLVQGDVVINGVRHYDNSAKTGAIDEVLVTNGTYKIKAPYGADVQVFNSCATSTDIKDTYNKDLSQLKASGRTLDINSLKVN